MYGDINGHITSYVTYPYMVMTAGWLISVLPTMMHMAPQKCCYFLMR